MGKVKYVNALPNLYIILAKEGFQNVNLTYLGGIWVLLEFDSLNSKDKCIKHVRVGSWFDMLKSTCNSFVCDERIVWVTIEGLPLKTWTLNTFRKVYWICAKELDTWVLVFCNGNYDSLLSDEDPFDANAGRECGDTVNVNATDEDSDVDRVPKSSFVHENVSMHGINNIPSEEKTHSDDPSKIYEILNRNNENTCQSWDDELQYPLGFTPVDKDVEEGEIQNNVDPEPNVTLGSNNKIGSFSGSKTQSNRDSHFQKVKDGGSILEVMDELMNFMSLNVQGLGHKAKQGWIQELCSFHRVNFIAIRKLRCNSGGILCVWEPSLFVKDNVTMSDYFVAIMGTWLPTSSKLLVIFVYSPQELTEKRQLWEYLCTMVN
ncbi:hypothetical protein Tco_1511801, partial [Tanacetum coccineum]